jgi:hypothetical protein
MRSPARFGRSFLVFALVTALGWNPAAGQERVITDDEWCKDEGRRDHETVCEVRERTLEAGRPIDVDASPNGGIKVEAWDRSDVQLRAKVVAWADEASGARGVADEIEVAVDGAKIRSEGPKQKNDRGWSVSFRLMVPRSSDLKLRSTNGGIGIHGVSGDLEFRTTNGGLHLTALAGNVHGSTTNGGLHIELAGKGWEGDGLDVATTNGGVKMSIPDGYSAHLETGTVNGGLHIDFPITVQGRIDRKLSTDLGEGGKTIRAFTTNGGVTISKS